MTCYFVSKRRRLFTLGVIAILISAAIYTFSCDAAPPPPPLEGSTGQALEIVAPTRDGEVIRYRYKVYPTEIALGDPLYVVQEAENVSGEELNVYAEPNAHIYGATLRLENGREFKQIYEELETFPPDYVVLSQPLAPGTTLRAGLSALEFPALEDWEKPIGQELRNALQEGDKTSLTLVLSLQRVYKKYDREFQLGATPKPVSPYDENVVTEIPITLVRREPKEAQRLEYFYRQTPPNVFPRRLRDEAKFPPQFEDHPNLSARFGHALFSSGKSDIRIGGRCYSPWFFVRYGNRKPSDPNNPTTLDGWRKLEAEFAPSTLRDEITLTRLQLEYYDAAEGEASDAALKTLVDWLSQRPEPQRVVLSQSLLSKRGKFRGTPLEAKNATLCDALTSAFSVETPATSDIK